MEILEEVRIRSQKSEEQFNEELVILIISEVEQFILNYCNIQTEKSSKFSVGRWSNYSFWFG